MGFDLFGYELVKKKSDSEEQQAKPSFVQKENDDGAVVVAPSGGYGTFVDLEGTVRSEAELITKYREMSLNAEVNKGINEIVNSMVAIEEEVAVKIKLEECNASDLVKDAIEQAFEEIMTLLNFNNQSYNIIRRWYIDGRLYYHTIIDIKNPKDGIQELRYIDPRKIRKIREVTKRRIASQTSSSGGGADAAVTEIKNEYYLYNERGFATSVSNQTPIAATATGLKIAEDSVALITSGLTDANGSMVLSYLHYAIKALNQLRAIEDASVIYRLARAPERRVWYIDVGNLPKAKAEQYVASIMNKHKNRLTYDAGTGEYRDDRKFMTMLEDYWLPRRENSKGTQVETLPAGENLGEMDDVLYFQKKLFDTLQVPQSRLNTDTPFTLGRATEITQDEVSFGKFIQRMRNQFSYLFTKLLERHIVLKQIMSLEDFQKIAPKIKYDFAHDNYFMEMKESEVQMNRFDLLEAASKWVGYYYSNEWVNKNILRLTEEEVDEMKDQIEEEKSDPIYSQPVPGTEDPMMDGLDGMGPEEMPMDGPQDGSDGPPDNQYGGDSNQPPPDEPLPSEKQDQRIKTQQRRDPRKKSHPS
jgi:hypothetical protein